MKVDTDCETSVSVWTIYVNIHCTLDFLVFCILKREKDIYSSFIGIAEGTFLRSQ